MPVLALGYWQKENKSKAMEIIKATKADWMKAKSSKAALDFQKHTSSQV